MRREKIRPDGKDASDFWVFSGISDMATFAETDLLETKYMQKNDRTFLGGTREEALKNMRGGDNSLVEMSDKIMAMIEDKVGFRSSRFATIGAVAGGAPNVPAFLSGNPVAMRQRRRVVTEDAPIAIIADVVSSGGVSHETIQRRGAALLALCRILESTRPVSLFAISGQKQSGKNLICALEIDTRPLDLARAAWVLGSPQYTRRLTFAMSEHNAGEHGGGLVSWAYSDHRWQQDSLCGEVARHLGFGDYVASPGITLGTEFETDEAAADWVMEHAKRLQPEAA